MSLKLSILLVLVNIICAFGILPPSPPSFSWDKIPLFIHAGNQSGKLNETAAKYMARFPLATIEKMQDMDANPVCSPNSELECEEDRIIAALKQIRSYNSETRTIFYMNSLLNFPQYNLSTKFLGANEKYLLHDENGKLVYWSQCSKTVNVTVFDLSYNETINFWLDTVKYAITAEPGIVDGIFADRGNTNLTDEHCISLTKEKQDAWNKGHIYLFEQAQKLIMSLNKDRGVFIANNADFDGVNARMFENFRSTDTWNQNDEQVNDVNELMNEKNKRITEVHGDNANYGSATYNSTVTAYLIGAYQYSYYACTKGWTLQSGWDQMWQNPDFDKALGEPITDAVYNNNSKTWSREFKSGTKVYLDFNWDYPCIKWSDDSITGTQSNCNKY